MHIFCDIFTCGRKKTPSGAIDLPLLIVSKLVFHITLPLPKIHEKLTKLNSHKYINIHIIHKKQEINVTMFIFIHAYIYIYMNSIYKYLIPIIPIWLEGGLIYRCRMVLNIYTYMYIYIYIYIDRGGEEW
jgi:mannose/fructose/N-acetylgalactosamine-specific phosphotransferase system component IIC